MSITDIIGLQGFNFSLPPLLHSCAVLYTMRRRLPVGEGGDEAVLPFHALPDHESKTGSKSLGWWYRLGWTRISAIEAFIFGLSCFQILSKGLWDDAVDVLEKHTSFVTSLLDSASTELTEALSEPIILVAFSVGIWSVVYMLWQARSFVKSVVTLVLNGVRTVTVTRIPIPRLFLLFHIFSLTPPGAKRSSFFVLGRIFRFPKRILFHPTLSMVRRIFFTARKLRWYWLLQIGIGTTRVCVYVYKASRHVRAFVSFIASSFLYSINLLKRCSIFLFRTESCASGILVLMATLSYMSTVNEVHSPLLRLTIGVDTPDCPSETRTAFKIHVFLYVLILYQSLQSSWTNTFRLLTLLLSTVASHEHVMSMLESVTWRVFSAAKDRTKLACAVWSFFTSYLGLALFVFLHASWRNKDRAQQKEKENAAVEQNVSKGNGRITVDDVTRMSSGDVERVLHPRSLKDIVAIVRLASSRNRSVSPRGQCHTMGGHVVPRGGYAMDMKDIRHMELIGDRVLRCGAGATWSQVIRYLNQFGLSPHTMQSYSSFSVGGTLSVNAHGITSDVPIIEAVEELRVVMADGQVVTCSRQERAELFSLVVGGYGLFGVIYEVVIRVCPNSKLDMQMLDLSVGDFDAYYTKVLQDASVDVKLARLNITNAERVMLFVFKRKNGIATVSDLSVAEREMSTASRLIYNWISPSRIAQTIRFFVESYMGRALDWSGESDKNMLLYESAKPLATLYSPLFEVDDTFILQEFFVPSPHFTQWMVGAKPLFCGRYPGVSLLNTTIRYVYKDESSFLRYAKADSYAFVLYWRIRRGPEADATLRRVHEQFVKLTLSLGGTFYLPYRHHYDQMELQTAYPRIKEFFKLKRKYDPSDVFSNSWFEHYGSQHAGPKQPAMLHHHVNSGVFGDADSEEKKEQTVGLPDVPFRRPSAFHAVFSQPSSARDKFSKYSKIFDFVAQSVHNPRCRNDMDIFRDLRSRLESQSLYPVRALARSIALLSYLRDENKELLRQVKRMVWNTGMKGRIHNLVSIGDPGRLIRGLHRELSFTGKAWIVHDAERQLDFLEKGTFFSVGEFVPIDYALADEAIPIPSSSADLVMVMMGLHHIRPDQLKGFLKQIYDMLRPGGIFLFREHDAESEDVANTADVAHSLFNVYTGVSEYDQEHEIRAFRSVKEWRRILTEAGFRDCMLFEEEELDSTRDVMMCFRKQPSPASSLSSSLSSLAQSTTECSNQDDDGDLTMPDSFEGIDRQISIASVGAGPVSIKGSHDESDLPFVRNALALTPSEVATQMQSQHQVVYHQRDPTSSYYRLPEWGLVSLVRGLADFMEHTPWYRFPYIAAIRGHWSKFEAARVSCVAHGGTGGAGYMMNVVIGVMSSFFLLQLFLLSLPLRFMYGSSSEGYMDSEVEDIVVVDTLSHDKSVSEIDWKREMPNVQVFPLTGKSAAEQGGPSAKSEGRVFVLRVPHFGAYTSSLLHLSQWDSRFAVVQVCGATRNESILLHVEVDRDHRNVVQDEISSLVGCQTIHEFEEAWSTDFNIAFTCRVSSLLSTLSFLRDRSDIKKVTIYDTIPA